MDKTSGVVGGAVEITQSLIEAYTRVYEAEYQYKAVEAQCAMRKSELEVDMKRLENELKIATMSYDLELAKISQRNRETSQNYLFQLTLVAKASGWSPNELEKMLDTFTSCCERMNKMVSY